MDSPVSDYPQFFQQSWWLSNISLSLFKLSSVFLFSFSMSCFRFSLSVIVMISLDTADVVVVPALSFTVGPMFERSSKAFKGIPAPVYRIFRVPPLLYSALLSMFFPWQNTGGDPVLFFFCLAVYDSSFEAGFILITQKARSLQK